jgi:hypothetical protein
MGGAEETSAAADGYHVSPPAKQTESVAKKKEKCFSAMQLVSLSRLHLSSRPFLIVLLFLTSDFCLKGASPLF